MGKSSKYAIIRKNVQVEDKSKLPIKSLQAEIDKLIEEGYEIYMQ